MARSLRVFYALSLLTAGSLDSDFEGSVVLDFIEDGGEYVLKGPFEGEDGVLLKKKTQLVRSCNDPLFRKFSSF